MSNIEIKKAFKETDIFNVGETYSNSYIKSFLKSINNAGHDNPTALTYNQWNCGMNFICPLFEKTGHGKYKYLGPDYPYSGEIIHRLNNKDELIVGYWNDGQFEFSDENINTLKDYKEAYCNSDVKIDSDLDSTTQKDKSQVNTDHVLATNFGFKGIGRYTRDEESNPVCLYDVKKTERLSLVYALVVGDEVKYIGKTIAGYIRPLSYLTNQVMKDVQHGILKTLESGKDVFVLAKTDGLNIKTDGLTLDICEGYEHALITKFKPEWNNHIR